MHPYLRQTVDRLVAHYAPQPWCAGIYLTGSAATGTDDEWSDIDLDMVVDDEAYAAVTAGLRAVCERECGAIHLWLPEGERPGFCNYAFLFEAGGEQFLADFALASRTFLVESRRAPGLILVDRDGLLARLRAERLPQPYTPDGADRQLPYVIDHYWVYAYLCGKYWRRQDVFKLLYVLQVLFADHVRLLRALCPDGEWTWWARDLKRLPHTIQAAMLGYFTAPDPTAIQQALHAALDHFAADARAACARWEIAYPDDCEAYVRRHLAGVGVLPTVPAAAEARKASPTTSPGTS